MHDIEPFYNWRRYYIAAEDKKSPFYGRNYGNTYVSDIYGYYIDPEWDEIDSETLYCKLLYANYETETCVIELFGEWNDTLHNDSMHFKRKVVDKLTRSGIKRFILIGENLLQFHGGDTDYYEEWYEDIEDGWIAAINLRKFIAEEFTKYRLDYYINFGGTLEIENWRVLKPQVFCELVEKLIVRRLN